MTEITGRTSDNVEDQRSAFSKLKDALMMRAIRTKEDPTKTTSTIQCVYDNSSTPKTKVCDIIFLNTAKDAVIYHDGTGKNKYSFDVVDANSIPSSSTCHKDKQGITVCPKK